MYRAGSGFLEKQAKEGIAARNHGRDRAGLAVGKETGDTGCCLLLRRDGRHRSSRCFVLPTSGQPPALWFSRALGDLREERVLPVSQAGPAVLQTLVCGLTLALCLAPRLSQESLISSTAYS